MNEECAVVFLAGGRSSRMGTPKAWLEFDGKPLLEHLVNRMLAVFPEAVVVGAPGQDLPPTPARVVHDDTPGEGPVGGMVAGLRAVTRPFAFVTSCDAPFLNPALAAYLAEGSNDFDVVVPEWEGRLQSLHSVYRVTVQPILERNLLEGRRRPLDLYNQVRTRIIPESVMRTLDPDGESFFNMNSPDDFAAALKRWRSR